uniref:Chromo domain-containing protein n=2 Tax=Nicotiana TaxID=4085 RepID=A0A1S4DMA8_TOBAC
MALYEALYRRRCRSLIGWFEVREAEMLGPDLVYQATEKVNLIQRHLKTDQSRQKSYSDVRHRDLEFQVDDWVFLKFMGDPSLVVPPEVIGVKDNMSDEEIPLAILDRQIRKLRTKEIASIKVLWRNQKVEEATWEAEEDMKSRYPHLFEKQKENVE